ncbi:MAG TPA: DUF3592 domain-containing protein [Kofleriaceae bacterium]|nr:DUF3592 domain-containing protein [Kofleriaceae bacterium]
MIKSIVIAVLCFAFGGLALWGGLRVSGDVKKHRDWPTVPGKILERRVGEPMGTRGRSFLPYVKYTYTVDGKEYTNDQVYLIRRTGGLHDKMQQLVDGLPDPVPVHYDPKDPSQSFLLVNPSSTQWILIAFAVFAIFVGLAQLLILWNKQSGKTP